VTFTHNNMNSYADDLAAVMDQLDVKNAMLVAHSTGGGEVARYVGRHGTKRVAKVALISAVPPLMLKTGANPEGIPMEVWDAFRASLVKDPSQFYRDFAVLFYGANRPGAKVSQVLLDLITDYIRAAQIGFAAKDAPLFRAAVRKEKRLTEHAMHVNDICRMVKRRMKDVGLSRRLSPHSFRVTTITDLLEQGFRSRTCSAWPAMRIRPPRGSMIAARSGSRAT